jgi:tripartite-type tricarboxylate transporter receptor subunit TctC
MKLVRAALILALSCAAAPLSAQTWPAKPVRMVVGFVAGGPTDALARLYAARLGERLGQQVVIENRGGADGVIAADAVAKSAPDGYTLFFASAGHAINASLYKSVPYRTVEDFEAVTRIGESPNLIAVTPSLPAGDVKQFIALAKAKPGALNYGATSSPTHLATELFASMAGIQLTRIPYKGAAPAMTALMAGDVQMVLSGIGTMLPQVKGGRLKAIAVTGPTRSPLAPEIPTVAEAGIDFVATTWYGLMAPAGTPRPIVERLNKETRALLADEAVKTVLAPQGVVATPSTPEEFNAFLRGEVAKWAKVVKDTGAKVE